MIASLIIATATTARAVTLDELLDARPTRMVCYKTADKHDLTIAVFEPAGLGANERRPAVVCIHGGGWTAGDAAAFYPHAQYFADRGAVGLSINYRLMGEGARTAQDALDDCRAAMVYLRAHADELYIDPKRIAVLGDSAGGHLAACLGTITDPVNGRRSRPDAMLLYNPITDLTEGNWWYAVVGKPPKHQAPTTPPPAVLERAMSLSPLFHIGRDEPPTLLMHGLNDHVVTPEQSRRFARALQDAGNECELRLVPDAKHAFVCTRYSAPAATVVNAIVQADRFLSVHHFLNGEPTLVVASAASAPSSK